MKTTKLILPLFFAAVSTAVSQEASVPATPVIPAVPATPAAPVTRARLATPAVPTVPASEVSVATLRSSEVADPVNWQYQDVYRRIQGMRARSGPVTYLGVAAVPPAPELAAHLPIPPDTGLVVEAVTSGSPAEKAGIQLNDVLAKLDDQILIHPLQLATLVANHKEGDRVKITLVRKAQGVEVSAELGTQKIGEASLKYFDAAGPGEIGLMIDGKLERPLRTFTRRFELPKGSIEQAEKAIEQAGKAIDQTGIIIKRLDGGEMKIARADDETAKPEQSVQNVQEEIQEIRRLLDALTKKLDEEKK